MKKFMAALLCVGMMLVATGCGDSWVEEGAAMLGSDIRDGEFVLSGVEYSFPMGLDEFLDNGWHISNNYDNKDSFKLEPNYESTEFELFDDNKNHVSVCVLNVGDTDAKLEDCLVSVLKIPMDGKLQVVLPGGVSNKSTADEVRDAYGKADEEGDSAAFYEGLFNFTGEDDWDCTVTVKVEENSKKDAFVNVLYEIPEQKVTAETCSDLINLALKTSYYGDYAEYVAQEWDTAEGAEALYQSELEWFMELFMYYAGIDSTQVSDEIKAQYQTAAADILKKVSWEITSIDFNEDTWLGSVEIKMVPTNFLEVIEEDLNTLYDNSATHDEYVQGLLDAVNAHLSEVSAGTPITKTYDINYNDTENGVVPWDDIDLVIMGFGEEE